MEDKRELKTFERTLGDYEVAGAICSYGDVIAFVDGDSNGIVLIDTMGHYEESGIKMGEFIRKQISEGWGHKDPRENIFDLRDVLKLERESHGQRWSYCVSGMFLKLENLVSLSMGGDMGPTFYLTSRSCESWRKSYHRIDIMNEDRINLLSCDLDHEGLLFIQTDGLLDNIGCSLRADEGLTLTAMESATQKLEAFLREHQACTPYMIRDGVLDAFSDLFLPRDNYYDDVTFAIIKKK
jgi:hypothetical protein